MVQEETAPEQPTTETAPEQPPAEMENGPGNPGPAQDQPTEVVSHEYHEVAEGVQARVMTDQERRERSAS